MSRLLLLALVWLLAPAAPARAIEVGMQDDQTILHGHHDRDLALDQFVAMGGTHVRINVEHKRAPRYRNSILYGLRTPMKVYDEAVQELRRRGLEVQMTLIWNRREDPAFIAAWMGNVAEHFGSKVNRYSVFNEPELSMPLSGGCEGPARTALRKRYADKMVFAYGAWRAKGMLVKGRNVSLSEACRRFDRGRQYRPIFNAAAKAIKAANPKAEVLAGETSALPGLEWFVRGTRLKGGLKRVDGWAHHPFQLQGEAALKVNRPYNGWSISQLPKVKRLLKLPVYVTEFGFPAPNSSMDKRTIGRRVTRQEVKKALVGSWRLARRHGLAQMLQYQWFRKPPWRKEYWETAILDADDGETTPAYRALKQLVSGWK
jgi:hypothetical protein